LGQRASSLCPFGTFYTNGRHCLDSDRQQNEARSYTERRDRVITSRAAPLSHRVSLATSSARRPPFPAGLSWHSMCKFSSKTCSPTSIIASPSNSWTSVHRSWAVHLI
jgi:hypothetical protein